MKHPLIEPLEARIAPAGVFSIKASQEFTRVDNKVSPPLTFSGIEEGNSGEKEVIFIVHLEGTITSDATVHFATIEAGATAGLDYTAVSGTLTFHPGETDKPVSVFVKGDTRAEVTERFRVALDTPTGASLDTIPKRSASLSILDDDQLTVSIDDVSIVEGDNGTKLATFHVTLSNSFAEDVKLFATTQGLTATSGIDFLGIPRPVGTPATPTSPATPAAPNVTILANTTSVDFTVQINGDLDFEADETFRVNLSLPTAAENGGTAPKVLLGKSVGVGTITNDDKPGLRIDDVQIMEGDAGVKQAVFTVTLDAAPFTENVTVDVSTMDGTATAGSDYTGLPLTTLTFTPGQTSKQVIVPILGDLNLEANEQFLVKLANPSANVSIVRGTGTGTILNDDGALRIGDVVIAEGAGGTKEAVFTVTLQNGPQSENVTVNFTTQDGTAFSASDFASQTGTLTFAPGEASKEIRVLINGDTTTEQNEIFSVKLSGASGNAIVADDTGTGTILNDDGSFLTIGDATIVEGDSGFSNMIFLVQLSAAAAGVTFTVDVKTVAGTALSSGAAADFTAVTTMLSFGAGETQKLVSVPIRGDLIREATETFSVVLSNLVVAGNTLAVVTILDDTAIGTINDNNDPLPTVSVGNAIVAEGNAGTSVLRFTATLSQPAGSTVTALFSTHNDSGAHPATAGTDYTVVSGGTVTFAPGESQAFIDIPIVGDTVDEFDETFGLTLSSPAGATLGTAEAIGTIQNDEVTVSIGDVSIAEGNAGATTFIFQVSLTTPNSVAIQNAVTVNFATADGTAISTGSNADFSAAQGTLTFTPGGARTQNVTVTVNGDLRFEGNEQFFVNLLSSVNAAIVDGQGAGTIQDDDPVTISIQDAAITEGNANSSLGFTISLDRVSDLPVTVLASTQNGTALAGSDFTAITNQLITIPAGQTSVTLPVNIIGDTNDENVETFTVNLSGATNATLLDGQAIGTITDDDLRTISVADVSVVEGDAGTKEVTFTVSLSSAAKLPVSFDFATANISAIAGSDYNENHGTVTIPAGDLSALVKVTVIGDTAVEGNERFFLNLSNAVNGLISGTASQARATIVDDETRLKLVPIGGTTVAEDGGTFAEFNVERSGDTTLPVSVQFETQDGSAKSLGPLADYTGTSGSVSFAAGSSTASGRIKIAILGDSNYENNDTFNVRLFNSVNAAVLDGAGVVGLDSATTVTITDNDVAPTLSIVAVGAASVTEGDSGTQPLAFAVRLSAANERQDVTVKFATLDLTANSKAATAALTQDYVAAGATLTFAKGTIELPVNITINGDVRDEADAETFQINLSGETNATISNGSVVGTINDNDLAPTLTFSTATISVAEGSSGAITLSLSEVSEQAITVQYTTKDGTAISTAGTRQDFTAADHLTATYTTATAIAPALKTFTFNIPLIGDTLDEADETFTIKLSNAVNARLAGNSADVTITDDDAAPVITINSVSLNEGNDGTTEMVFTVSLSAASGQEVSVNYSTPDGVGNTGATSRGVLADFIATSGTLKFAPEETQKEIRVTIKGDTFKETDETFTVALAGEVNGAFLQGSGTGTGTILTDGDTALGIAIQDAFSVEGDSGVRDITFTVELSQANATTATTFNLTATNGTAVRGSDFVLVTRDTNNNPTIVNQLSGTIAANAKTTTFTVQVNGDGVFEATESFFVNLKDVTNSAETAITIAGGAGRGTIYNDDLRRVDDNTIQFIDVDGDLATVHVSTGALLISDLIFGNANDVGGRQLQAINFIGDTRFQRADLTVSAKHQPGFKGSPTGVKSDGHVNVGSIFAASVRGDILQFVNGIDLGAVNIDGDLGKIVVGDDVVTPAIGSLVVRSMGRFGTTTQGTATGLDTTSLVLGPVGSFIVHGNFKADFRVLGSQFGSISYLQIDGGIVGGADANTGTISFTGKIKDGYIGKITGGAGANSGTLSGSGSVDSRIVNLVVGGLVSGGAGAGSGVIFAPTIKSLRIGGLAGGVGGGDNSASLGSGIVSAGVLQKLVVKKNITGGAGENSGQVIANTSLGSLRVDGEIRGGAGEGSGAILARGAASQISVFGSLIGGAGAGSGRIKASGAIVNLQTGALVGGSGDNSGRIVGTSIQKLSVFGNIEGGTGNGSGGVELSGKLASGLIGGDILGGDSRVGATLLKSGYVIARKIKTLDIQGDLKSGANAGAGLAMSGTVRAETSIGLLHIRGSIVGSEDIAAIIAAPGTANAPAIQSLKIDGEARFAEILAGYGAAAALDNARGAGTNSDAQLGKVVIGGDVRSISIIAGVDAGADGLFGSGDDIAIGGTGTTNNAGTVSKIAQIVLGGTVRGGTRSAGIEAQFVDVLKVRGTAFPLTAGAGNDVTAQELETGSKIRVFEVPLV